MGKASHENRRCKMNLETSAPDLRVPTVQAPRNPNETDALNPKLGAGIRHLSPKDVLCCGRTAEIWIPLTAGAAFRRTLVGPDGPQV